MPEWQALKKQYPPTRSGILLQRISWKEALISGSFRNFWATLTLPRLKFIPTFSIELPLECLVLWINFSFKSQQNDCPYWDSGRDSTFDFGRTLSKISPYPERSRRVLCTSPRIDKASTTLSLRCPLLVLQKSKVRSRPDWDEDIRQGAKTPINFKLNKNQNWHISICL